MRKRVPRIHNVAEKVGYGHPPRHTQFKKGQSGNPKGRPRGSLNIATILARTLREKVVVNENGRRRTITKLEAAVKQIVNKAAAGDAAAIKYLFGLTQTVEAQLNAGDRPSELPDDDRKVMAGLLVRLRNVSPPGQS